MIYFYLFALIVGGVLLAASVLLGGSHDSATEHDSALTDHSSTPAAKHLGDVPADMAGILWVFASMRFWTFFLAFFGLTGAVLGGLGLIGSSILVAIIAAVTGLAIGGGAAYIVQRMTIEDTNSAASTQDYIGKSARVIVPVGKGGTGKVRIQLRGTTVDVLASGSADDVFAVDEEVLVIEMNQTTARIARA